MSSLMRYKNFTWPHNPKTYSITYERQTALHKIPAGAYTMEDMGRTCRVMRGAGEFYGKDAYASFKKLAAVFYEGGAGMLIHPVWMSSAAYFTGLTLTQEPTENYVAYTFEFRESFGGYAGMTKIYTAPAASPQKTPVRAAAQTAGAGAKYYTVVSGDSLWAIGKKFGLTVAQLLALNPAIANPNLIRVGQKVRVA